MSTDEIGRIDRISLDRHIRSVSRYSVGAFCSVALVALAIYVTMQVVLERHSVQQRISFLTGTQFIKFQQLASTARALMRASADDLISEEVLDRLTEDMKLKIFEIREISVQLKVLQMRLGENADPDELDLRLASFLERADRLGSIDNVSRGRRYSFWGPIDFAAASDSFIMRGFQEKIRKSFAKSEESIEAAKKISALLILSLAVSLFVVGSLILWPLVRRLGQEYEKKKVIEEKLSILAHTDGLTGISNRLSFKLMLNELIEESLSVGSPKKGLSFCLFLLDLDHFKAINDTFGHQAGDELLIEVAQRISSALGAGAKAARLGGDEFAILAPSVASVAEAEVHATLICKRLSDSFAIGEGDFCVSGSIGCALYPIHADNAQDLIRSADLALYAAKERRNGFTIFSETMKDSRLAESRLRTEVPRAMEKAELLVFYQPKIDVSAYRHAGFEALIRWDHPDYGVLPPGRFLHLFDTTSLITAMTEFVVQQVARDIRSWRNAGLSPGTIAINMPEAVLISNAGFSMIENAVRQYSLEWSDFAIEITEDVFVNKYMEQILETVAKLRKKGVSIDLDDFGTGFASLTNLRNFPFDDVKIDRSFVSDIGINTKSEKIIRSMIDLVDSLGKSCIAEGVETEAQFNFLKTAGCAVAQGYFFSKPVTFEIATNRLEGCSIF